MIALIASGITFLCWAADFGWRMKKAPDEAKTQRSVVAMFKGKYPYRTFAAIQKQIGGYSNDDLRKMLLSVGAIRVHKRSTDEEMWVLREIHEGITQVD
jgi:hypothetical protein